jgi:hypothetical protein
VTARYLPYRRSEDARTLYQTRPVIIAFVGRRHVLSPTETHFLLSQLALLPERRWRGVGDVRERIGVGLARGWPVTIADSEAPVLLRAVEGLRVVGRCPPVSARCTARSSKPQSARVSAPGCPGRSGAENTPVEPDPGHTGEGRRMSVDSAELTDERRRRLCRRREQV